MNEDWRAKLNVVDVATVTTDRGTYRGHVTAQRAHHLYELDPNTGDYDYYQVDLRDPATLFGYVSNGVGFDEESLGEIVSLHGVTL